MAIIKPVAATVRTAALQYLHQRRLKPEIIENLVLAMRRTAECSKNYLLQKDLRKKNCLRPGC